jgi:adenosylcobinamide kinase/adenosylcobinamide-phosphate guanylyltransferase
MEGIHMITLVLGGNKSGKSDFALNLLEKQEKPALFIATGKAKDLEFRHQINDHRISRAPELEVMEVSLDLPQALRQAKADFSCVLVDSLDYWLFAARGQGCEQDLVRDFVNELKEWEGGDLILVSCEAGLGPLPMSGEVRSFIRALGALNQSCAQLAHQVFMVAAGLPLTLKKV